MCSSKETPGPRGRSPVRLNVKVDLDRGQITTDGEPGPERINSAFERSDEDGLLLEKIKSARCNSPQVAVDRGVVDGIADIILALTRKNKGVVVVG